MEKGAVAWRIYTENTKAFVELRFDDANDTKIVFQVGDGYKVDLDNSVTWNAYPDPILIGKVGIE
jgi:hypothetical protein